MALVLRPYHIRLSFIDNDGAESTCSTHIPSSAGAGAGLSFALAWRNLVIPLSDAVNTDADLIVGWTETTPAPAGAGANVRRAGTFIFNTSAGELASIRVPSIDESLLLTSGPYAGIGIDLASSDVAAFVSAIAGGVGGVQACDPFLDDLVSVASAFVEQF